MRQLTLCILLMGLSSCSSHVRINPPYLLLHLPNVEFFIQGEEDPGLIQLAESSGLELVPVDDPPKRRFLLVGYGAFSIGKNQCTVSDEQLVCNGEELDISLGGVALLTDGRIVAVNPLTVFAK